MESQQRQALNVLEATSRTFYIPISRLPSGLLEAVGSGYLCMRAIDEIEDHPDLDRSTKVDLLRYIGQTLQAMGDSFNIDDNENRASKKESDEFDTFNIEDDSL